jgi:hypothetical protein
LRIPRDPRPLPRGYISVTATLKFTYYLIKGIILC